MYERRKHPLISKQAFAFRLLSQLLCTFILMLLSLGVGIAGYHYWENLPWIDALLNASMILGGMGEVDVLKTDAGKYFASFYALYSQFFMLICAGLLLAPVFHRVLHHFHQE